MLIIGCDYHPSFQQIAFVDTDTGELQERRYFTTCRKGSGKLGQHSGWLTIRSELCLKNLFRTNELG